MKITIYILSASSWLYPCGTKKTEQQQCNRFPINIRLVSEVHPFLCYVVQ